MAAFDAVCDAPDRDAALRALPEELRTSVSRMLELDALAERVWHTRGFPLSGRQEVPADALPAQYTIHRPLGEGGMGVVYEAEQALPRRRVALKVLRPELAAEPYLSGFRAEAQALADLALPGIPEVYEAGVADSGLPYLAMQLVEGPSLRAWATGRGLPARVAVLQDVAWSMHRVHEAGLLHRDLKPSNIIVSSGQPWVLDFGIAAPPAPDGGPHPGTPRYMAPEALRGEPLDRRADVFALGIVAAELLGAVDGDLADVIARAVAPARAQRCPSMADLAHDLGCVLGHRPLPWKRGLGYRLRLALRRRPRRAVAAVATATALAAALAGGSWARSVAKQQAQSHLDALDARVEMATADGRWDEAGSWVEAFLAEEEVRGTDIASQARLSWALRLNAHDQPGAQQALADALVFATHPHHERVAAVALGRRMHAAGRYADLVALGGWLDSAGRAELAEELTHAGIAMRSGPQAADVALLAGRPWHHEPSAFTGWVDGRRLDVDGDRFVFDGVEGRVPHPGWTSLKHFVWHDGALHLATGTPGTEGLLHRMRQDGTLEHVADLGPSGIQQVVADAAGLWIAQSYPDRGIARVRAGRVSYPLVEPVDSDVMDLRLVDLDADGIDEIVVPLTDWHDYAVRVYRQEGDQLRLASRDPVGRVWDVAIARDGGGPRVLAAVEGGLHVLGWADDGLVREAFVPYEGPTGLLQDPEVGDVDGDGRVDVVWGLSGEHVVGATALWVVWDVLGTPRTQVLPGLRLHDGRDVDGDGTLELAVRSDDGTTWILGSGETRLPTLAEPRRADLGPAPGGSPLLQRSWSRAQRLVEVGLAAEAAEALQRLAAMVRPDAAAACHHAAGGLFADLGDHDAAIPALQQGGPAAEEQLAASYLERLDVRGIDPARGDAPTPRDMLADGLSTWFQSEPSLRATADGVRVDAFNDQGVLARRLVDVVGPWVELQLDVLIEEIELGAGLQLSLQRDGVSLLRVAFQAHGAQGQVHRLTWCGPSPMGRPPHRDPAEVSLRAGIVDQGVPRLRCALDRVFSEASDAEAVAQGPAELVLSAFGEPDYLPPTRLRAILQRVQAVGLRPRGAEPRPRERAVRALSEGRHPEAAEPDLVAAWAISQQDDEALERALVQMTTPALRRLVRRHGPVVVPVLKRRLTPEALAELLVATYREPASRLDDPRVHADLLRVRPADLPVDHPAGQLLWAQQAHIRWVRGEHAWARTLATTVLERGATGEAEALARAVVSALDAAAPVRP